MGGQHEADAEDGADMDGRVGTTVRGQKENNEQEEREEREEKEAKYKEKEMNGKGKKEDREEGKVEIDGENDGNEREGKDEEEEPIDSTLLVLVKPPLAQFTPRARTGRLKGPRRSSQVRYHMSVCVCVLVCVSVCVSVCVCLVYFFVLPVPLFSLLLTLHPPHALSLPLLQLIAPSDTPPTLSSQGTGHEHSPFSPPPLSPRSPHSLLHPNHPHLTPDPNKGVFSPFYSNSRNSRTSNYHNNSNKRVLGEGARTAVRTPLYVRFVMWAVMMFLQVLTLCVCPVVAVCGAVFLTLWLALGMFFFHTKVSEVAYVGHLLLLCLMLLLKLLCFYIFPLSPFHLVSLSVQ